MIVGASVRALAMSAVKGGYGVDAFDMFADWDTKKFLAPTDSLTRISKFEDVLGYKSWADCDGAIVAGGMENRIGLVAEIEKQIPILGSASENRVRLADAPSVFEVLKQNGLQVPASKSQLGDSDDPVKWLSKNAMSSGGLSVNFANELDDSKDKLGNYFQKLINGGCMSAVMVGAADKASCVGVSLQLVGDPEFGASSFQYCGSVGPIHLSAEKLDVIQRIGNVLVREFGIKGLFGFDFINNSDGVFPIDINPRVTASAELYESAFGHDGEIKSLIDLHVKSCSGGFLIEDKKLFSLETYSQVEAKIILFNRFDEAIAITDDITERIYAMIDSQFFQAQAAGFTLADLPCVGEVIDPRHPILTLRIRFQKRSGELGVLKLIDESRGKAEEIYSLISSGRIDQVSP